MIKRFAYQIIVSIIVLFSVLIFGTKGFAAFALMVFISLATKNVKLDEREYQLFYKTGNNTLFGFILSATILHLLGSYGIATNLINQNWLIITVSLILFIQGVVGIFIFKKG